MSAARIVAVALIALSAGLGGCGRKGGLPQAHVEGKVLYRGKPLAFGMVMFQPEKGKMASGTIQPDGTFVLSTHGDGDGAVLGKHRVQIICYSSQDPNAPPAAGGSEPGLGKPLIPVRYTSFDTSQLTAEVKKSNEPMVFDLKD